MAANENLILREFIFTKDDFLKGLKLVSQDSLLTFSESQIE